MKDEEKRKREIDSDDMEAKRKIEKLEETKKKMVVLRKELTEVNEKLRVSESEKAVKEAEYERQVASSSFKENLPQLQKQLLHELENLENAVYDLDYKQTEWQEKMAAITELVLNPSIPSR